jgi:penicillin G amidase
VTALIPPTRRWRRVLRAIVVASAAALGVVIVSAYGVARRSLPQVEGRATAPGLRAPVSVFRDGRGVPRIVARSRHDALFALGYVHAQDRLWEMTFQRIVGQGRLAEIFGSAAVPVDRLFRTVGIARSARSSWEACTGETRESVTAYVAGINAFLYTHDAAQLPPELLLLGVRPEPWSGADVMQLVKMLAWGLNASYGQELRRGEYQQKIGRERARQLFPGYPEDGPSIVENVETPSAGRHAPETPVASTLAISDAAGDRLSALDREVARFTGLDAAWRRDIGSNAWVVDGTRSATGKPVLANDTHNPTDIPSLWYLARLHAPDLDVAGGTIPGLPGVIAGHNRHIAWGITNLEADVQDLFRERLDALGRIAEYAGGNEPVRTLDETVKVRGGADVHVTVRFTRHGPLLSDALDALRTPEERDERGVGETLALRWPALHDEQTIGSFLRINEARDWGEFTAALQHHAAPALGFVYADVAGNIGFYAAGDLPLRPSGADGSVPAEGWTGAQEWKGLIPFDEKPHVLNPAEHFIVSANHRPVGPRYPYALGQDWAPPYRAARIAELLGASTPLSVDAHAAIQGDTLSRIAHELVPELVALTTPRGAADKEWLDRLARWDGRAAADSAEAALFEAWKARLLPALVADELGPRLGREYRETAFLIHALKRRDDAWCDDVSTAAREDCAALTTRTFQETVGDLTERLGGDGSKWQWGRLHRAVFAHQPFHSLGPLRALFSREIPSGGDESTVSFGGFGPETFDQRLGATFRQIVDLRDLEASRFAVAIGASGHVLSRHYDDGLAEWPSAGYASRATAGGPTLELVP